jgi:hypothetical protein
VGGSWALLATPIVGSLLVHARHSARRLNAVVIASVLTVAEQLGMTVVGSPDAFQQPMPEPSRRDFALPAPGAARKVGARSLSPILARAAGLAAR